MKRVIGMEGREERSKGIEIRIADDFTIIKPTAPFKLAKHEARRKRNWSDSSDNSLDQNRYFTVSVQEQETNKFFIQSSCSVHR
jgi:hypothetical protein